MMVAKITSLSMLVRVRDNWTGPAGEKERNKLLSCHQPPSPSNWAVARGGGGGRAGGRLVTGKKNEAKFDRQQRKN